MCETKIYDIDDLRKFLVQTWFDFDIMELAIDQWHDHLTSCVRAGGGHFEHMFWNECSFYYDLLWPPCLADADIIFVLWLLSFFFLFLFLA